MSVEHHESGAKEAIVFLDKKNKEEIELAKKLEDEGELSDDEMKQLHTNVVLKYSTIAAVKSGISFQEVAENLEQCAEAIREQSEDE